jgi:hypothetical protein
MKALTNINAHSLADAVAAASAAIASGRAFAFSGGGTDLLQQIKDGTNQADVLINLRTVREARTVSVSPTGGTLHVRSVVPVSRSGRSRGSVTPARHAGRSRPPVAARSPAVCRVPRERVPTLRHA